MEFRGLKAQYQALKNKIDSAIIDVVDDGNFIMGKQVMELEQSLAEYVGVKHCITCANGTDAMTMVLMAWGIQEGDAVFVSDFTFFASSEVISYQGAVPIFIDVDGDTFNMDFKKLEEGIKKVIEDGKYTPKAIIAVDLFGLCADYNEIEKIAKKYNLLLLEDGAQGFGGSIKSKRACSFGNAATTSFFPAKPLGCYGDGGAIFTSDDNTAEYLKSIRVHGKGVFKYDNVRIGVNSRMDTLQAAILQQKFQAFTGYELECINKIASTYTQKLKGIVKIPKIPECYTSSWAQYTIVLKGNKERDGLKTHLEKKGIPTMIYYPKPLHMQTVYKNSGYKSGDFPVSETLSNCVLSLPIHPYLKESDIEFITKSIKEWVNKQEE